MLLYVQKNTKKTFVHRYQVGVARAQTATYRNLLTKLPGGSSPVENAYDAIEQKISQVREYVHEWLRYQALWDLQPESLYGRLGEDITLWIKCLNDIKLVNCNTKNVIYFSSINIFSLSKFINFFLLFKPFIFGKQR